jgi:hypothetical protein
MAERRAARLAAYERQYARLAAQLATIGFISSGSVVRRYTHCSTPGCHCHTDPSRLHGPYYQWSTKLHGKTVSRRITAQEAQLYQEWIANDRRMRRLIQQMRQIAAKALELRLQELAQT